MTEVKSFSDKINKTKCTLIPHLHMYLTEGERGVGGIDVLIPTGSSGILTPNLHLTDVNEVTIRTATSVSLKLDHLTGERRAAGHIDLLRQVERGGRQPVTQLIVHEHLASCHTVCRICTKQSCVHHLHVH